LESSPWTPSRSPSSSNPSSTPVISRPAVSTLSTSSNTEDSTLQTIPSSENNSGTETVLSGTVIPATITVTPSSVTITTTVSRTEAQDLGAVNTPPSGTETPLVGTEAYPLVTVIPETNPSLTAGQTSLAPPEQVNDVINNVKKTISEIIKDVLEGANDDTNTEDILKSIVAKVPATIKIMTADVDGEDLRSQITDAVSVILSEKAAVQLRNRGEQGEKEQKERKNESDNREEGEKLTIVYPQNTQVSNGQSNTVRTVTRKEENDQENEETTKYSIPGRFSPNLEAVLREISNNPDNIDGGLEIGGVVEQRNKEEEREEDNLINLTSLFPDVNSNTQINNIEVSTERRVISTTTEDDTGLVLNLRPRTTTPDPLWEIVLTVSPGDNEIESSEPDLTNNTSNIIQDGRIFADTSSSGVVKAKVVEDTNFLARSIGQRASIGIAAIISIVIGVLAVICFSLMVFLAMARRRRELEQIGATSSTGYASNSRYSPETANSSTITEMKPAYMEELSPNVSSFDLQKSDVVIPMDGHLTIVSSYEDFLDVPTGARPNLLQTLPVSPLASFSDSSIPGTQEMNDPELAFVPRHRPDHHL